MPEYRDAWEDLYRGQARPWRGIADISWMDITAGEKVLDLGCGNGKTSAALVSKGAVVTGADFSPSAVKSCKIQMGKSAEFVEADVRALPFDDGTFDKVVAVHVLEHVPEESIGRAVGETMRVLRQGGRLYLKAFAEGDMRSEGKKEDVRNGILYRYFSEEDVRTLFQSYQVLSIRQLSEDTRFGSIRRRLECVITKE